MKKTILLIALVLGPVVVSQGALSWRWQSTPSNTTIKSQITSAMNTACNNYNTYASYTGTITVNYNSGVPTAQTAGAWGLITFGGSRSARVAQHEIGHWHGCGTYWDWNNHRSGNLWTGAKAKAKCTSYGGGTLYADSIHFWPYGWNYDNEGPARNNIGMVGCLIQDMGLINCNKPGT
jgi:hypothetical protein